ncbi:hypothetical protein PV779_31340 [Streptomyces sp. ID01-9D]|nr:hypothetical protein [Streptomyces sp. ID01-9D]
MACSSVDPVDSARPVRVVPLVGTSGVVPLVPSLAPGTDDRSPRGADRAFHRRCSPPPCGPE